MNFQDFMKESGRFWEEAPHIDGFKSDYAALYFAIADSVNKNYWKDTDIEYDRIINKVRMGKRMYLEARGWLHQNGFIIFTPGRNEYSKAKFNIAVQKCTAVCTAAGTEHSTTDDTTHSTAAGTLLNKTIHNTQSQLKGDDVALEKSDFHLTEDERGVVTCQVLRDSCVEYFKSNKADYPEAMYKEFILYWSEPNSKGIPRWFSEKKKRGTWHLPGRLATWSKNYKPAAGKQIPLKPVISIPERLKTKTV